MMRQTIRTIALAMAATLLAAAPAQAGAGHPRGRRSRRARERPRPCPSQARDRARRRSADGPGSPRLRARRSRGARGARARALAPRAGARSADRRAVYTTLSARCAAGQHRRAASTAAGGAGTCARCAPTGACAAPARDQLGYVIDSVEALALSRGWGSTRMPAAFVQLDRNRRYWRSLPYPGAGDQVSFRGSEVLYQYFPGEGLQLHPLSTFKKANHMHGACERGEPACDEAGLRRLLDEMAELAVQRSRGFIAWEYAFHFGGGSPPWISGMAEATGIQAYGARRAAARRAALPRAGARRPSARSRRAPPRGVRTTGPARRRALPPVLVRAAALHLQRLPAVADRAARLRPHRAPSARATRAVRARPSPRRAREIPLSDVGDWSRYSYGGAESTRDYHELLREFLQSMCTRRLGPLYCDYADALPRLPGRPARARPTPAPASRPRTSRRRSASRCRSCRPSR